MRLRVIFLAAICTAIAAQNQPELSISQCRSDYGTWYEAMSMAGSAEAELDAVNRLPMEGLIHRMEEMTKCVAIDSQKQQWYVGLAGTYSGFAHIRERDFIERHHLMDTFLSEDAAGKR